MAKHLITANDVELARSAGVLTIPRDAIVTPLARDKARDLGIEIVKDGDAPRVESAPGLAVGGASEELTAKVRAIVTSLLGSSGGDGLSVPTPNSTPPVVLAKRDNYLNGDPFTPPGLPAGMQVTTIDAITGDHGSPMAAGYMTLTKGDFPWEFTYDEVQIILEGELHLGGDGGGKVGRPGDIFYVPKGSKITFGTPTWTKFVYVTFPANWEG